MAAPIACVDLGTNTCLLLVARRDAVAGMHVLHDQASIVRLGKGVDGNGALSEAACERTLSCLHGYAATARQLGATQLHLVATSAMRDASNGPAFALRIQQETGFQTRIISGEEEAELTWLGIAHGRRDAGQLAAFDVGGGSTELMLGDGDKLLQRMSVDVGSVRLTERILRSDPPTGEELLRCKELVAAQVARLPKLPSGAPLMGIAGTVTTLAACARQDAVHNPGALEGQSLSLNAVEDLLARFAAVPAARRLDIPPLEAGRADVIVAGAIIVAALMRHLERPTITVGDRGVRYGLFWRLAPP